MGLTCFIVVLKWGPAAVVFEVKKQSYLQHKQVYNEYQQDSPDFYRFELKWGHTALYIQGEHIMLFIKYVFI